VFNIFFAHIVICYQSKGENMTKDLKAIIKRSEEAWNTGDLSIIDEIYAPNYVMHYTFDPSISDLESYKQFISKSREAMPDLHVKIEDSIAEDDKVACRWVVSGTYTVDLFNISALGKKATWAGMTIYRFKSGKIVESWWSEDIYGMLQQLGVIPTE
jgi:steroid delta-isomerase-like uncharacterized protein